MSRLPFQAEWISRFGSPAFKEAFEALRREPRYERALQNYGLDDETLANIQVRTDGLWTEEGRDQWLAPWWPTADTEAMVHLPTILLLVAISVLSLTPDAAAPGDSAFEWLVHFTPTAAQKLLHVGVYAALTVSAWLSLGSRPTPKTRLWLAVAFAVGFGAVMEWLQTSVPGRYGSLADVLLNAGGALVGAAVVRRFGEGLLGRLRNLRS